MGKDKILYISLVFIIPLAIAVVYLTWKEEMPLKLAAICCGLSSAGWIVLTIYRARQISKKSEDERKRQPNKIKSKTKNQVIERIVSLILLVCAISNLVYRLVAGYSIYAHLFSILFILIFSLNAIFLLVTTDD